MDVLFHDAPLSEVVMDSILLLFSGRSGGVAHGEPKCGRELLHEFRYQSSLADSGGTADDYWHRAVAFHHPLAPCDHLSAEYAPLFSDEWRVDLPT